jgi:hypothetical protein
MRYRLLLASAAVLAFSAPAISQQQAATPAPEGSTPTEAPANTSPAPSDPATAAAADSAASEAQAAAAASAPPATAEASTPVPNAPTPAETATSGSVAQPGAAAPADVAAASGAAPAPDPAKAQAADQMIAQSWSKYDKDNTGQLTPLAFGEWVLAAQGNDMSAQVDKTRTGKSAGLPATKVLNATAAEFSRADANKDRMVSREELKAYLAA